MTLSWTNIRVRLGDLKPWADNPRLSTKKQAERLLASFDEFGQVQTIAVSPELEVYDGHQRLSALLTLHGKGYEVDARQASRALTDEERRKLVIYLHSGAVGSWDWDALSGWNAADMIGWGMDSDALKDWKRDVTALTEMIDSEKPEVEDVEPQIDRAEELRVKWGVESGQLWQLGEHRLICGDSLDTAVWQRLCGDEKARLTWTDPPYGVKYGEKLEDANPIAHRVRMIQNDDLPADKLEEFIRTALIRCSEHSLAGAAIYVACPAGTLLPALISAFAGSGFTFHWHLVWLKDQIVLSRADYHFKHENILYGWKPDGAHYFTDSRKQSSVFEYPRPKISEEHPTMKPVELVAHMIRNSSREDDIVLEPFSGSGPTLIACENLGRKCRAIEISPAYVAVALQRWADLTGRTPELIQ